MKYRCLSCFGVTLTALCLLAFSTADAYTISLIPDADARLSNDSNRGPTSNNGTSSVWEIRHLDDGSTQRVRIGYVRYDISSIDPAVYDSATITGTFQSSTKNGPSSGAEIAVYGLNDDVVADPMTGRLGNDWPETSVNYSNAAGVVNASALGTLELELSELTFLGSIFTDGIDVQPLPFGSNPTDLPLGDFLAADTDGLVTFLFIDPNATGSEFNPDSKEGNMADGHGPTTLNFVPEPSSYALIGLALAGWGIAMRRQQR